MTEITIGTWNALNTFGDETLDENRMKGGLEVVRRMDADVLVLPETAVHGVHTEDDENERLEKLTDVMAQEGYTGTITDYIPPAFEGERNAHYMSMWTRIGDDQPDVRVYGKRNALHLWVPNMGNIHGVHLDDRYPQERVNSVEAIVATRFQTPNPEEDIVAGDLNDIYPDDPRGRIPRAIGKVVNGIEVRNYYDRSKPIQRLAGKVIRVCRMSRGDSLKVLKNAGFHGSDPNHLPTIGNGIMAYEIDHIEGTEGIEFTDPTIHDRGATPNSPPLSDHSPKTARARRM